MQMPVNARMATVDDLRRYRDDWSSSAPGDRRLQAQRAGPGWRHAAGVRADNPAIDIRAPRNYRAPEDDGYLSEVEMAQLAGQSTHSFQQFICDCFVVCCRLATWVMFDDGAGVAERLARTSALTDNCLQSLLADTVPCGPTAPGTSRAAATRLTASGGPKPVAASQLAPADRRALRRLRS
jgi:hypothetical protein